MKNKIKQLLKNKDAKSLIENFFSLGALQVINLILPLVVLPYMIKTVGFDKYGVVVLAASLIAYFSSVTDYSFTITATRDVAVFRDSPQKINIIYSKVLIVKSILLLFSWLIIGIIVFAYLPFYEEKTVFFCSALMLFGYVLFPEWFFQGIEKMKFIAFLNVGIKVFFTACIFILVRTPEDYWKYALLNSIGYIGAGLIGQYLLIKKYKLKFIWLKNKYIRQTFKSNFPVFINRFVPNLYNNTSTFLLGVLANTSSVGLYDAIKKIIDLGVMVISVISRVFFPYLNRNKAGFAQYMKGMIIVGAILAVSPIIFYKIVFWYLNIQDADAFWVLLVLSIGLFFITLYDVFGLNYFIVNRKDKIVMRNTLMASLVGLVLAYPLISYFGIIGAAINLTLARVIMGGGMAYNYIKKKV
ncbi:MULTISPECIES: oligosaccharide flippase family protein [Weeksella]|uniref:Polysaccharide biosynthesis protein n=1 Tax=Weeksella virosa (strain ATCC 43766 / DSM 16922 / JCM 21250 / CCUG 30538 / CDC 9751 / IAM 14551 / NBRC 16016 / NCTC 11634 / CL345/78) TaxID=865938 RepID=F0P1P1_WEEVC|nr:MULTISPECIES: oligosaccharide flippase family protein [Weeksella]ADX67669.1 polysaccharide biosynthesis protein [Weeksella virosa DSM 16922]MDK7373960.1 oligosaccharide flippase family protein [Weeksella virosa]MDK7674215.1 oligosaccharide flippase family protein [Weeksella virosa]OFM82648.1 polysaccharide biosynthesis protein [Weeksella sp. HMSC059D05]VEH64706.1 Putative O-antigen transporter [Weeksella virosa]